LANEALLFGKKLTSEDLEKARFIKYVQMNMIGHLMLALTVIVAKCSLNRA
jgi:hypothetical protein